MFDALLPKPQFMGSQLETSEAIQQRDMMEDLHHAPDVPPITPDMNPYMVETGVPPAYVPPPPFGAIDDGSMDTSMDNSMPTSPDEVDLLKQAMMQRLASDRQNTDQYQEQAVMDNKNNMIQQKRRGF